MNRDFDSKLHTYYKGNKKRRLRNRILTVLGSIVVFITTYMLILPAITVEQTAYCGIEEHQHSDACYGSVQETVLEQRLDCSPGVHKHTDQCFGENEGDGSDKDVLCGYEDFIIHTHSELCYRGEELICSLPEIKEHKHVDECYKTENKLICTLEESYHIHGSGCFEYDEPDCGTEEGPDHLHTIDCYSSDAEITCGVLENPLGHLHGDECYEEITLLVCTVREAILHTHTQPCYKEMCTYPKCDCQSCAADECTEDADCVCDICTGRACECEICQCDECTDETCDCEACAENRGKTCKEDVLVCTQPILTEHKHTSECFVTVEVTEYREGLVCTAAEHTHSLACMSDVTADLESKDDWEIGLSKLSRNGKISRDILAIAKTQLGYAESKLNYAVADDGVTVMGYTRYGQWYGSPYSDWNALFTAFCAYYANTDVIPKESDITKIIDHVKSSYAELYKQPSDYFPGGGDIAVIDVNGDGVADKLGIVSESSSSEGWFRTIEGDVSGTVAMATYSSSGSSVIGYVQLTSSSLDYPVNTLSDINITGTVMYHAPEHIEYQYSSHRVGNFMTLNYVLIPYDTYLAGWTPNVLDWSANAGANYIVAYGAQRDVAVSETGEKYTAVEIEESATYKGVAELLSGIVEHAYPFITADEMRSELAAAYQRGEIAVDLSCCVESEFIAAAQWAIWDMSGFSETQTTASLSTFPDTNNKALNPLTDVGHTDKGKIQGHVKAIRDWLVTQRAPARISVEGHTSSVTRRADGSYDITTTVTLSRPLVKKEEINVSFKAGSKVYETVYSAEGGSSFEISLTGLSESEVLSAGAELTVLIDHMQVYVYDSETNQDMISGQWGIGKYNLTFTADVETTDVEVEKIWSDGIAGAESVTVQLYADGKKYGEAVTLSAENGWKHSWSDLIKYSAENVLIDYTVTETPVPGYLSVTEKAEGGQKTVITAAKVSVMEEGKRYVIIYDATNALGDKTTDSSYYLDWFRDIDTAKPGDIPAEAVWVATSVSGGGSYAYLYNESTGRYLYFDGSRITLSRSPVTMAYYLYDHFYFLYNGNNNRYLTYLYEGEGYITDDWDSALSVSFYELSETSADRADFSYTITNTKAEKNTSVEVLKEWVGKPDGEYPASITVTLHQNGTPYGTPVELSTENGWRFIWEDLPIAVGDVIYEYTVEESVLPDYSAKITKTVNDDGSVKYLIVNTWDYKQIPVKLLKTDSTNASLLLAGAEFYLYCSDENGETVIPGTNAQTGTLLQSVTTGSDGTAVLGDLEIGRTYYLIEVKAPSGYNKLTAPVVFATERDADNEPTVKVISAPSLISLSEDTAGITVIDVKNKPGYLLPETGGIGTYTYTIGGALIMLLSLALLLYKYKRHEGKSDYSP
ncbi:MAG: Cna B-type domain-containing protein [Clostridia bacterium]|nr:Cna B-type domain-containing protein [Clostridia bacterium]